MEVVVWDSEVVEARRLAAPSVPPLVDASLRSYGSSTRTLTILNGVPVSSLMPRLLWERGGLRIAWWRRDQPRERPTPARIFACYKAAPAAHLLQDLKHALAVAEPRIDTQPHKAARLGLIKDDGDGLRGTPEGFARARNHKRCDDRAAMSATDHPPMLWRRARERDAYRNWLNRRTL